MKKDKNELKKDRGVALVTVIVVVAFLSILSTMILYTSSNNFYMKSTDIKTKENFYTAETGLEEFRALLTKMYTKSFEEAYEETQINFIQLANGANRKSTFCNTLFTNFRNDWNTVTADETTFRNYMKTVMADEYVSAFDFTAGLPTLTLDFTKCRMKVSGVVYVYEDANKFVTKVHTDFWMDLPEYNWDYDRALQVFDAGEGNSDLPKNDPTDRFRMIDYVQYHGWTKE